MTDDTISRRAAIEAVSKGCEEFRGIFEKCEDNILSLPSAPRWIPCKERLPEKFYERVLICGKRGGIAIANYRNILPGVSPFWVQGNKTMEAVAWMPLPEPWKGE